MFDLFDGGADQLPAAGCEAAGAAEQAGDGGGRSGDGRGFCFFEQGGQGQRRGALRGAADRRHAEIVRGVGGQAVGDERPRGLGGRDLARDAAGSCACERARDGDQVRALEPLRLRRGSRV